MTLIKGEDYENKFDVSIQTANDLLKRCQIDKSLSDNVKQQISIIKGNASKLYKIGAFNSLNSLITQISKICPATGKSGILLESVYSE